MIRLLRTALLGCLIALLWACGEQPSEKQEEVVTLVFKHSKLFGDPEPLFKLIEEFEKQNPGIKIKDETLPSSSDEQHQFYVINLRAESTNFDVFAVDVIWVAEFARAGWLRDISHLLPPEEQDAFFEGPIQAVTYQDRAYAIPWFIDAGLLYYRKDLLEKYGLTPPETWDELVRAAREIKAQEDIYGFVWQGKQYEGLVCNVLEFFWSNGGAVLEDGRVILNNPENRQALQYMYDLIYRYEVTPEFVNTLTEEPSRRIFGDGKAVFHRNWPYAWNLFQREGSAVKDKVGISTLPHFDNHQSAATLGGWQLGINPYSKHPEAAERFLQFITSPETQKALVLAYGFNPTRKALYQDSELLDAQPFLGELYTIFEKAKPRPVSPFYVRISQVLQAEFSAVISGVKEPEPALGSAQQELEDILNQ